MAAHGRKFLAENIVAILKAAKQGGNMENVVERAGVDVPVKTVESWLGRGRREKKKDQQTPFTAFLAMWEEIHPGGVMKRGDPAYEMQEAVRLMKEEVKR